MADERLLSRAVGVSNCTCVYLLMSLSVFCSVHEEWKRELKRANWSSLMIHGRGPLKADVPRASGRKKLTDTKGSRSSPSSPAAAAAAAADAAAAAAAAVVDVLVLFLLLSVRLLLLPLCVENEKWEDTGVEFAVDLWAEETLLQHSQGHTHITQQASITSSSRKSSSSNSRKSSSSSSSSRKSSNHSSSSSSK
ncbi:hypothetical protein Emag_004978 [Eimeria magna]